jgi:hypothetical protein
MIFLSKNGKDEYINMLARGCGMQPVAEFDYRATRDPVVLRGILKHKIMKQCWEDNRDFYYMDTGYFGNERNLKNPNGWKHWHRIVKNNLQHGAIIPRPSDRFDKFNKRFKPWNRTGRNILLALPDEKPCKFYGIDRAQWTIDTVDQIKAHTDRPIVVRERAPNRVDRTVHDTLEQALINDVFALVTFNSVAAVESIFNGIPAFTLAPVNAASPVSLQDLSQIESPYYASLDKLHAWACHLAYGQVHIEEMKNGSALEIIQS